MGAKSAEEVRGLEHDWLASDGDGHVALFSTAGGGYAPPTFLREVDEHDRAIDAILVSPASTAARFAPDLPPDRKNTWRMVADRGLFAFDSDVHGGPYRLVAAPETPVRGSELPPPAADLVARVSFRHLAFGDLAVLSEDLLQNRE